MPASRPSPSAAIPRQSATSAELSDEADALSRRAASLSTEPATCLSPIAILAAMSPNAPGLSVHELSHLATCSTCREYMATLDAALPTRLKAPTDRVEPLGDCISDERLSELKNAVGDPMTAAEQVHSRICNGCGDYLRAGPFDERDFLRKVREFFAHELGPRKSSRSRSAP